MPVLHAVPVLLLVVAAFPAAASGQGATTADGSETSAIRNLDAFSPDALYELPDGPTLAHFRTGVSELVSIRASVPFRDEEGQAGVGRILAEQADRRMESLADRIGARAGARRTAHAIVYQVTGAAEDLDFLAWILGAGLARPAAADFEAARREVRTELERRLETPNGTLALRLLAELAPGSAPISGTTGTLDPRRAEHVSAAWARTHRGDRLRIVTAGPLEPAPFLAALSDLDFPDGDPPSTTPVQPTGAATGSPELNRHWIVRAYPLPEADPASAMVAVRHLNRLLGEETGEYETSVALWELDGTRAVVVTGAAYDRGRGAMEPRLDGLLEEAIAALDPARTGEVWGALATEIRLESRTPSGLAGFVGSAWDADGDPEGAARLLGDLARVESVDVQRLLEAMAATTPLYEELRP